MSLLSAGVPHVHQGCLIAGSTFGAFCDVGAMSRVLNSEFRNHVYCDRLSDIANTAVGQFANITAMMRIGPTGHPRQNATLHHFLYCSHSYWNDAEDDEAYFARRESRRTVTGPATWLGHGAVLKPDVSIGAVAIAASGTVVTRDVAPYMIVADVPTTPLRAKLQ